MKKEKVYYLRDAVHLDIIFEERFFNIISTIDFQRLSRIKQLSCEYLVFPTALHNRFSHSIGTFHVMKLLVDKISKVLKEEGIEFTAYHRDLALVAALLHDIGHGPFSHTFEKISTKQLHEMWTVEIIENENTEINKALKENFPENFVKDLVSLFDKEKEHEPVHNIISQLISSKLDADRMDYLLRDSYFTGVNMGVYDLHRLISSLDIAYIENKPVLCVNEKYISPIEEYIMARFYMHKEAYQHPLKKQLENVIQKIFKRAKELYSYDYDIFYDKSMEAIFKEELDIKTYLSLDDNFILYHISRWKNSDDMIMQKLCSAFLDRKKFTKYRTTDNLSLADRLNDILISQGKETIDWNKEYCYISETLEIPIYNKNDENIWIKKKDGSLVDISEESHILSMMNLRNNFKRKTEFYHKEMLKEKFGIEL